jgi:periplasmic protein CpxP/Spy
MNVRTAPHPSSTIRLWLAMSALAMGSALAVVSSPGHANPVSGQMPVAAHHDMMMQGGPGLARMLDAAKATPDQRAQIEKITASARDDMKAGHELGAKLREQTMALFAQPTVDTAAAEALRQQMLSQHDQATRRMLQAMVEVSQVLTPEQRQQIAEQMKSRGERARHRHGERPAGRS